MSGLHRACWARFALSNLLALFLLLAQAGALAHGIHHFPDRHDGHEPVCEQCLAYAAMGAGLASTPPAWSAPTQGLPHDDAVPPASPTFFRPGYRSRAPPSPNW
jgi:hypothetical protein